MDTSLPKQNLTALREKEGESGEQKEAHQTILLADSVLSKILKTISSDRKAQTHVSPFCEYIDCKAEWSFTPTKPTVHQSPNQEEQLGIKPEKDEVEPTTPISVAQVRPEQKPPSLESQPEPRPLPRLPPDDQLLPTPTQELPPPESIPEQAPATLIVEQFKFEGNTVFSDEKLADLLQDYTNRRISFTELLQARSEITQLYVNEGYTTSGAIIAPQKISNPDSAVVTIKVVEGTLEEINVTGTRRLKPSYVSSRLARAAGKPFNINELLQGLQLLQLDPVIGSLSADLQAGTRSGTNILQVEVEEADTFSTDLDLNNARSPTVGSFQRGIVLKEANLLGFGDAISLSYNNTDGSNGGDLRYSLPISPDNSKVNLAFGITDSNVIEEPFNALDISSDFLFYELGFTHPLIQTPTEELALGLTLSHQQSQSFVGIDDTGAFSLAAGGDDEGRTSVFAVRFSQEWTKRSSQQVLAFRSQFSLGLDVLGATINDNGEPDSRFFAWRGQGQWARLLARDTLLLLKTDLQLSDSRLLALEQFRVGGSQSVRGYRQDLLLRDNGFLASAEVRLPILRVSKVRGVLQVVPFIDVGTAWNNGNESSDSEISNTLVSTGLGLLWQMNNLTARLDFGIPLVSVDDTGDTLQENGFHFSVIYTPF
ncbi:MAG: ShlB/FhaC/HecB family hemolysin secretion/activation protein [Symploca sp. SIO2E9]|nr:ShlB/FhaC/HecB family hemolysin secretion/activation protein [Symploca sp. SIO2E9]